MTDILDETEVAALLACEPSTVQTMAREGELPAVKFGKHWRFPRAALLEVVNRRALENTAPKPKATPRAVLRQVPSKRRAPPDLSAFLGQA